MKISQLIAGLRAIQKQHGDLTCAEEVPLGFFAIRYIEMKVVPQHFAVHGVKEATRWC